MSQLPQHPWNRADARHDAFIAWLLAMPPTFFLGMFNIAGMSYCFNVNVFPLWLETIATAACVLVYRMQQVRWPVAKLIILFTLIGTSVPVTAFFVTLIGVPGIATTPRLPPKYSVEAAFYMGSVAPLLLLIFCRRLSRYGPGESQGPPPGAIGGWPANANVAEASLIQQP